MGLKKILTILLALVLLCPALCVNAAEEPYPYSYSVENGSASIQAYHGAGGTVVIPETLGGYPVTSIGSYIFSGLDSLTGITIPDSVVHFGDACFSGCKNLETVSIGKGLMGIPNQCFRDCTSLRSVNLQEGLLWIGMEAFYGCTSLQSVYVPDSVIAVRAYAFRGCTELTELRLPSGLTDVGPGLVDSTALYNEKSNWENDVLYLGTNLIRAKTRVSGVYTVREGTTAIAGNAFAYCSALEGLTIPESVVGIGRSCLVGSLLYQTESNWEDGVLYVGDCLMATKEELAGAYSIKDGTRVMCSYAFKGCSGLTEITLPDTMEHMGEYAFEGCSGLETMVIPDAVQEIEICTFQACTSLREIRLGSGVRYIGLDAFWNCPSLQSLTLGENVAWIGYRAFGACVNMEEIYLPASLERVDERIFAGCRRLRKIICGADEKPQAWPSDWARAIGSNAFRVYWANGAKEDELLFDPNEVLPPETLAPEMKKFLQSLRALEADTAAYYHTEDTFGYVTRYLRSDRYSGLAWDLLVGKPEAAYVQAMEAYTDLRTAKTEEFSALVAEGRYTKMVDLLHLMATLDAKKDFGGWAGEIISLAETVSSLEEARLMIANNRGDFSEGDYASDVDAVNLIALTECKGSLADALEAYYSGDASAHASTLFVKNRFGLELGCSLDAIKAAVRACIIGDKAETETLLLIGRSGLRQTDAALAYVCDAFAEKLYHEICRENGGHTYTKQVIPASCAEGKTQYVCDKCGDAVVISSVLPVKEHTPSDWKTTLAPTVAADGKEEKHCTVCDALLESRVLPAIEIMPGDLNGDGVIDAPDYLTLKRYILETLTYELSETQLLAADFNGDGAIEPVDYIALKKRILSED